MWDFLSNILLWSIAREALPLGELLQRRGIRAEANCCRCNSRESAIHTFFKCEFAQEVWKKIPLRYAVHLAADVDFKGALVVFRQATCLPPTGIASPILPWVCWALWSARNMRIFENRSLSPTEVATNALRLAQEWNKAHNLSVRTISNLPMSGTIQNQGGSNEAAPICRSDAAYEKHSKRTGLAWIIMGASGNHLNQGSTSQELVSSPLMAEALAFRAGIISAVNLGFDRLKIFSDNSTLIRAINNDTQVKEIFDIVKDIQQISSVFVEITVSHIPRSSIVDVDLLAKCVLSSSA